MTLDQKRLLRVKAIQYASLISVSIIIGIVIGLFQVALRCIFIGIEKINESSVENPINLVIYSVVSAILIFGFYILTRYLKLEFTGGTVVLSRHLLDRKVKLYEYPLLLIGFILSLFVGLPVGNIEICQFMGVALNSEVQKRMDLKDNDSFDSINSATFGAAIMSPLAGLAYGLESRKWKVKWQYVLKTGIAVVFVVVATYLTLFLFNLQNNFMYRLEAFESFSWGSLVLYGFLGIVIALVSFALNLSVLKLKEIFKKNKKYKNAPKLLTWMILIVSVLCTFFGFYYQWYVFSLAGFDGSRIILNFVQFKRVGLLIGTLFLWIFYIFAIPHSNLIGGKIIPLMTLGGIIGMCLVWNAKANNLMNQDEYFMMISTGMFALFGVVYKKPVTAICLALTFSKWEVIPYQIIPLILSAAPGYILMLVSRLPNLNECLGVSDSFSFAEENNADIKASKSYFKKK